MGNIVAFPALRRDCLPCKGGGDMPKETTKIYIRRGKNGYKYAAYTASGDFIGNLEHLRDAREHWKREIKAGIVQLVRDL